MSQAELFDEPAAARVPHVEVIHADCLDAMRAMPDGSIDSIVTDPPYGLSFMGREWDHGVPGEAFWREALRVAKPGAHLVAFGGTRTYHRLACAIEDAGWEIRDCLSWLYGSGFPKSHDVSKAIDKAAGAAREVVGLRSVAVDQWTATGRAAHAAGESSYEVPITAPATDAAREWSGWGTALKPAWEPAIVARKPLVGTVAANVLVHGTGAINVDGCRIGANVSGRWPSNVAFDEEAAALLDAQAPLCGSWKSRQARRPKTESGFTRGCGETVEPPSVVREQSRVPASRFFYVAKASRSERTHRGAVANPHPTVKPLALMRWLVRLVTPPGGVVLDPFAGSGTTGLAAREEGFDAVLVEREAEYAEIIRSRLRSEP